ncbi:MAG: hypothetical protein WD231_05570 [Candidatus Woykebacteria bacterium]
MATSKKIYTTQEHLDVDDIRDSLVVLKNGEAVAMIQTSAINFDLLSEREQDAMIFAYAALLNSLTFPIQILVRSKRLDISNYLDNLALARRQVKNPLLAGQIDKYAFFIRDLVSQNQVLDKRFYIVVPYLAISLAQLKTAGLDLLGKKAPPTNKWVTLEKAKVNLEPKIAHITKQLNRIGIKAKALNTEELVELFYDLYNPEMVGEQKAALSPEEYTTPIVEPAVSPVIEEGGQNQNVVREQP